MRQLTWALAVWAGACAHSGGAPCPPARTGLPVALPADVPMLDHASTLVGTVAAAGTARAAVGAEVSLRARAKSRGRDWGTPPDGPGRIRGDSAGGFVALDGRGPLEVSVRAPGYQTLDTVVTLEMERVDTLRVALRPLACARDEQ